MKLHKILNKMIESKNNEKCEFDKVVECCTNKKERKYLIKLKEQIIKLKDKEIPEIALVVCINSSSLWKDIWVYNEQAIHKATNIVE